MNAFEIDSKNELVSFSKELYQSACDSDSSEAPLNTRFVPCKEKITPPLKMNPVFSDSTGKAIGGAQYKAGFF